MSEGPIVAPRRSVIAAGLLFLSVATSIGAASFSRFNLDLDLPDVAEYVSVYQGARLSEVPSPYRYRIVVPLLARAAPDLPSWLVREGEDREARSILFRFALINLIGLATAALLLFQLMHAVGFDNLESLLGGLLFLLSFPALTIATLPLVDAWAYAMLAGALYALVRRNHPLLFVLFAIGMFTKETTILVPLAALLLPASRPERARQAACFLPPILAYLAFRAALAPIDPTYSLASTQQFLYDVVVSGKQLRLVDHGIRAFGLLWLLGAYGWLRLRRDDAAHVLIRWAPLVPIVMVIPFLLALHVGRVWFFAFPVVIPLAVAGLLALFRGSWTAPEPAVQPTAPSTS